MFTNKYEHLMAFSIFSAVPFPTEQELIELDTQREFFKEKIVMILEQTNVGVSRNFLRDATDWYIDNSLKYFRSKH